MCVVVILSFSELYNIYETKKKKNVSIHPIESFDTV